MVFQTKAFTGESSNVRFLNGVIPFSSVILNAFCFEVDGVLIDTGAPRLLHKFKPFFTDMDVDQVMVTHSHEDHIGGVAFLQKEYKLPIYLYE